MITMRAASGVCCDNYGYSNTIRIRLRTSGLFLSTPGLSPLALASMS